MPRLALFLMLLVESLWLGETVYFSAFAANELFAQLSENAAAAAVGALFPTYFLLSAILGILTFGFYVILSRAYSLHSRAYRIGVSSALIGAVIALINYLYMLPHIQRIERAMGPIASAPAAMVQQFGMWHGISMLFDLLMGLFSLIVLITMAFALPTGRH